MKYLIGLGALVVVVVGYFALVPADRPAAPVSAPAPTTTAPTAPAPVAPAAITPTDATPAIRDDNAVLEDMVAGVRDSLPSVISDTLTMTDAIFLPRMRIIEYSYVTTAADARASANELRAMIEARSQTICLDSRAMFELGVTLRNSFADRAGTLLQRTYLLPDDCQGYY